MTRRVVSLSLPSFATDRLSRRLAAADRRSGATTDATTDWRSRPLATVTASHGGQRLAAVNQAAADAGAAPGLPLADARAVVPSLYTAAADPAGDRRALEKLAEWCGRYTPWTAVDESGGLWFDVSGCAHLFDGERALLHDLTARLGRLGLVAVAAVADTPGAAWAVARFAAAGKDGFAVVPEGGAARALAPLPVAGLRLPTTIMEGLARMGLRRIGELMALPRAPLVRRFGDVVVERLDQALGRVCEPLSPLRPPAPIRARLSFPEPIAVTDVVAAAARRLLEAACGQLARIHQGARRLELVLYRVDGTLACAAIGTSRPVREPDHLERLLREKLAVLDAGFGVEVMVLAVAEAVPLPPVQIATEATPRNDSDDVARLIDRLGNRLGVDRVVGLDPVASHVPERACREVAATATRKKPTAPFPDKPRPVYLLPWPEPIDAIAPVPDRPPVMFRWRRHAYRVARADGPERICPEWWRETGEIAAGDARLRDYYRVEDSEGGRFWVFREGPYRLGERPRWYLHGFFP